MLNIPKEISIQLTDSWFNKPATVRDTDENGD